MRTICQWRLRANVLNDVVVVSHRYGALRYIFPQVSDLLGGLPKFGNDQPTYSSTLAPLTTHLQPKIITSAVPQCRRRAEKFRLVHRAPEAADGAGEKAAATLTHGQNSSAQGEDPA